jgi:hypothetical protein
MGYVVKLRNCALGLIVLLGVAYAKDKQMSDFPMVLHVVVVNGSTGNLHYDCAMSVASEDVIYNISSNGFCNTFALNTWLRGRVYDSKLGITIMEIGWLHGRKYKTAKYRVDSQIAVQH